MKYIEKIYRYFKKYKTNITDYFRKYITSQKGTKYTE